jgi:tetratricopeptide (TPR) repeat protein
MQWQRQKPKKEDNTKEIKIPAEIQKYSDDILNTLVEIEKENYHSDLVPFSHYEKQMREKDKEHMQGFFKKLRTGGAALKELMEAEERKNPTLPMEALYSSYEECSNQFREKIKNPDFVNELDTEKSFQELNGLSWAFMDRAYEAAKRLLQDKRLEEAECAFMLLTSMNSDVFEYWFGQATSLYELGRFKNALDIFSYSLDLQPKNPFVFFQMANCMYKLDEIENCVSALDTCIEFAKEDPNLTILVNDAVKAKKQIQAKKAA